MSTISTPHRLFAIPLCKRVCELSYRCLCFFPPHAGGSAGHPALPLPGEVPGDSSGCPYCIYYNQTNDNENGDEQHEDQQRRHNNPCHGNSPCHSPCRCNSPCRADGRVSEPKRGLCERCWAGLRAKLELVVGSRYFNRGIMIAILINTLSMGIEYHEQVCGVAVYVCVCVCQHAHFRVESYVMLSYVCWSQIGCDC